MSKSNFGWKICFIILTYKIPDCGGRYSLIFRFKANLFHGHKLSCDLISAFVHHSVSSFSYFLNLQKIVHAYGFCTLKNTKTTIRKVKCSKGKYKYNKSIKLMLAIWRNNYKISLDHPQNVAGAVFKLQNISCQLMSMWTKLQRRFKNILL